MDAPVVTRETPFTVQDAIARWAFKIPAVEPLRAPPLDLTRRTVGRLLLAVESMQRHMTDEGGQLQEGLWRAGYDVAGPGFPPINGPHVSNVRLMLDGLYDEPPSTVVVQDKREWDPLSNGCLDPSAAFHEIECLRELAGTFRVTVLKDAHQEPAYHRDAAQEMGAHGWITYYHPEIVRRLAPYCRPQHLIRTYHSIEPADVPGFGTVERVPRCLLSGAISRRHYPLRSRLAAQRAWLPATDLLPHPGYDATGSRTPDFLKTLSGYRVAICTASVYGYAIRKIIEATACGCRVITDLPLDDVMPSIDRNLTRVHPGLSSLEIGEVVRHEIERYDPERQREFASRALEFYDWRVRGRELANQIEHLRTSYGA